MERRKFSREFKIEAIRLVRERGVSVAQASREIDVHENILRKLVKEFGSDPKQAFPGHGRQKVNAAYSHGGAELTMRTLNENFGLNLTKYVVVGCKEGGFQLTLLVVLLIEETSTGLNSPFNEISQLELKCFSSSSPAT